MVLTAAAQRRERSEDLAMAIVLAVVVFELTDSGSFTPEPMTAAEVRERTPFYGKALTIDQVRKALRKLEVYGLVRRLPGVPIRWLGS